MTPPSLRGWFKARYARRLAAAFVATALLAAALTTALVKAAFQDRFSRYVYDQQQQRTNQIVAAAGDIYQQSHRWDAQALDALAVPTAMTGSTLQIRDAAGRIVYDTNDHGRLPAMGAMHRQMMGVGPLGPTQSVPIVVDGTRVGSAVLAVPSGGLPISPILTAVRTVRTVRPTDPAKREARAPRPSGRVSGSLPRS